MPIDGDVVRRVRKYHLSAVVTQQLLISVGLECAATQQEVRPELPQVAELRGHRPVEVYRRDHLLLGLAGLLLQTVEIESFEAGDLDVEIEVQGKQFA